MLTDKELAEMRDNAAYADTAYSDDEASWRWLENYGNDVPRLLDEIERLRSEVAEYRTKVLLSTETAHFRA